MTRKRDSKRPSLKSQVSKREIRSKLAKLKKAGVISPKIDVRSVKLTDYRMRQVRAFKSLLEGSADIVKIPKRDRQQYRIKLGTRSFGSFLIVPKEHEKQTTDIITHKGRSFIRIKTPLGRGEISQIILPYDAKDIIELATAIQNDDEIPDQLPYADQYAFALYGHTSKVGFPTKQELVNHILINYKHLFDPRNGKSAVKHFVLVNYGGGSSIAPEIPESIAGEKYISEKGYGRVNSKGRNDWHENRVSDRKNKRRRESRAKLTGEAREKYLAQMRERAQKAYYRKKKADYDGAKF
jgi:hypothetical protein